MTKSKKKTMAKARKPTSDAVQILRRRYVENNPDMARLVAEELSNLQIARKIYDLRTKAGLSQRALAKLVGTTASVICRPEATCEGSAGGVARMALAFVLDEHLRGPGSRPPL
jgi:ribosome-binding protein aMBF1 (putative translation factor)